MSQLWSVTCHVGSHSVTFYPTQVNAPCLHPSQSGRYSIYLPWRDRRLSWPRWLVTYREGPWWFTCPEVVTHPSTNRAQCRLTSLIKPTLLTTTLRRYLGSIGPLISQLDDVKGWLDWGFVCLCFIELCFGLLSLCFTRCWQFNVYVIE